MRKLELLTDSDLVLYGQDAEEVGAAAVVEEVRRETEFRAGRTEDQVPSKDWIRNDCGDYVLAKNGMNCLVEVGRPYAFCTALVRREGGGTVVETVIDSIDGAMLFCERLLSEVPEGVES